LKFVLAKIFHQRREAIIMAGITAPTSNRDVSYASQGGCSVPAIPD